MDGFIKIHDKVRRLILFDYSYCNNFYCITYDVNHNFAKVKFCSYDSLTIEKVTIDFSCDITH